MEKTKRKPITKKLRFDVFKRDGFACQYCGGTPPKVVLEIDHIQPVKNGGDNEIDNLITACFDCNRGKSSVELNTIPDTLQTKAQRLKEKEEQYAAYKKLIKKINSRVEKEVESINDIYNSYFEGFIMTDKFKQSVRSFISQLGYYEVEEAMHKACSRTLDNYNGYSQALKYFCGICWRSIKDDLDRFARF